MAVTLQEYMRSVVQEVPTLAGVLQTYRENAPILGEGVNLGYPLPALAFSNSPGGVASFVRQKTLPNTGFRALNSPFTASNGETEMVTVDLKIGGGRVEIDRALVARGGQDGVTSQMIMQVASMARTWNECFYKGRPSDPNAFEGLNQRLSGDNVIDNGGTALASAGLDLALLDDVLLRVRGGNKLIVMGTGLAALLFKACKTATNVNYTPETFGMSPATYNGAPILLAGEKVDQSEVLGFDETGNTTSLYVLALGPEGVEGVQTGPMRLIYDNPDKVDSSYEVEWDSSFLIKHPRAAYRISGISNAAITL